MQRDTCGRDEAGWDEDLVPEGLPRRVAPPPADYDPHKPLTVERNPAIPVVTFRKPDGTPMAMARPHTPPQAAQPKPLPRDAPVEFQSSPQTPMAPLMLGKDKATWLELSTGEKAAAIQLGYHETLWNTGGAPREVYKVHWNELDEIKLKAAKDLGITRRVGTRMLSCRRTRRRGVMMVRGRRRQRTGPAYI